MKKYKKMAEKWEGYKSRLRDKESQERERDGRYKNILRDIEHRQIADRSRVDGSALLFQANFRGSNQSTAPDIDRATAICWEISPLIGPTEKATASALQHALHCLTFPHTRLYKQLGLPINHHNDRLLRLTRRTGLTVSDYFMMLEQCVSVFNNKKSNNQGFHCQSVSQSASLKVGNTTKLGERKWKPDHCCVCVCMCVCESETVRSFVLKWFIMKKCSGWRRQQWTTPYSGFRSFLICPTTTCPSIHQGLLLRCTPTLHLQLHKHTCTHTTISASILRNEVMAGIFLQLKNNAVYLRSVKVYTYI